MLTCPNCNSQLQWEALTEDTSARQLFALAASSQCMPELVSYLGLFKPRKQALKWSRALKLTEELLGRFGADPRLGAAMVRTVDSLREKRQQPGWRPLQDHNYLARVIESTPAPQLRADAGLPPGGKTRERSLEQDLSDTSWADKP